MTMETRVSLIPVAADDPAPSIAESSGALVFAM